jgi:hypothetical protein
MWMYAECYAVFLDGTRGWFRFFVTRLKHVLTMSHCFTLCWKVNDSDPGLSKRRSWGAPRSKKKKLDPSLSLSPSTGSCCIAQLHGSCLFARFLLALPIATNKVTIPFWFVLTATPLLACLHRPWGCCRFAISYCICCSTVCCLSSPAAQL